MLKRVLKIAIAVIVFSAALQGVLYGGGMWLNLTSSMPQGIYRQEPRKTPHPGDHVLSCIPKKAAVEAYTRGYLGFGTCPGHTAPVGKELCAQGGDHVVIDEQGIWVNGILLENTLPRPRDGEGRRMELYAMDRVLEDDELLLASRRPESYDSRYFGTVDGGAVRGVITPIYLF